MTFNQIINYADSVKPNPFDESTKLSWLCEAEGLVRSEIMRQSAENIPETVLATGTPSAHAPYARLYSYYLFSMIDFLMADYDSYKISSEMFEKALESYGKWYVRRGEG